MNKLMCVLLGLVACFGSAFSAMVIDTSFVGDIGNAAHSNGKGAVNYGYNIGTYEVTNAQYVSFLNAKAASDPLGLYNPEMTNSVHGGIIRSGSDGSYTYTTKTGKENMPVNFVSFWDAARFTNWLTNGEGNGDTETGMYTLTASGMDTNTITRNMDAWNAGGFAITSEDEWFKAAYYKGGGLFAGYWTYANQKDTISASEANYENNVGFLTAVGSYASTESAYGTFDQNGNVFEWNEEIVLNALRGLLGGAFNLSEAQLTDNSGNSPHSESVQYGFRISQLAVIPEPSTVMLFLGGLALLAYGKRFKQKQP
ncbi:SUMF1/EgtB/PvdO family nonheme iron enzyme [Kiritimatiellaeota bacterium B1221]|nr:SUMF1/EgtB/PvdO family nonheme iron enzyme [Kiritimatiellaeota bacterium B1221]